MIVKIINVVTDENHTPVTDEKGNYLCSVQLENGSTDVMLVDPNSYFNQTDTPGPVYITDDENDCENTENINGTACDSSLPLFTEEPSTSRGTDRNQTKLIWTDKATEFLLDQYIEKYSQIGPLKPYKYKREMWDSIAKNLKINHSFICDGGQCENRYKSVMRGNQNESKNNKTSGNVRKEVKWEEQIRNIRSMDDSQQPEVLIGIGKTVRQKENSKKNGDNSKKPEIKKISRLSKPDELIHAWRKMFKQRERNKDRRLYKKMKFYAKSKEGNVPIKDFKPKKSKRKSKKRESSDSSSS